MRRRGFTLIEVLVALAVVALALVALVRTAAMQVQAADALRERTLASWVAGNVLAETRLATAFPSVGRSNGQVRMAGRDWRWEREISATPESSIRRIDVRVHVAGEDQPSAVLAGFAAQQPVP